MIDSLSTMTGLMLGGLAMISGIGFVIALSMDRGDSLCIEAILDARLRSVARFNFPCF